MVFQLWSIMMGLVLFAVVFMWVVQIFLFEQNYAAAALEDTQNRLQPAMETLQNSDLSEDGRFLPFLSRITDGTLFLLGEDGRLVTIYALGHEIKPGPETERPEEPEMQVWDSITRDRQFDVISARAPYQNVVEAGGRAVAVEIGFPITFGGRDSYLVIHHELQIDTILHLNRRQLIILSIFLTLAASVLAFVCSRHFTKPIYAIKDTIDRLAEKDFAAKPEVARTDEFGQLAESVEVLGQALHRVDVLRKEVIANVSHELKSPLSVISGYAEMVRDIDWKDEDRRNEDLELIISESRRMTEMVNDILDYSQLQSGYLRLNLEDINLGELAESETSRCLAAAKKHGIRLEFKSSVPELMIHGDPLKLSQVMRNLLYNAINHTPEGGTITVWLKAGEHSFRLEVQNPGDPIPEADRKLIWERYQRSQHHSGRNLGTGIGLSIVKTILEAHGMEYGVECDEGETVFWFGGNKR